MSRRSSEVSGPSVAQGHVTSGAAARDHTPFAAMRHRNFAIFWTGALVSNTGSWVQNATVPVVVFNATNSAAWVGFVTFVQFAPMVVLGPYGGALADRFHRRSVLITTQSLQALVALALCVVWVTGRGPLWAVVGLVTAGGVIAGLNIPSWQAFVGELVPRDTLLNAVTLNSTQFNASRAFGPAIGGLVLGLVGPGLAFLVNAASFTAVIGALLLVKVPRLDKRSSRGRPGVLREFMDAGRATRREPAILVCFVAVFALGSLGGPLFQLLAVFAERVFHVTAGWYGLLGASLGIGAIAAAPVIAGPGSRLPRSRLLLLAMLTYGSSLVLIGAVPIYAIAIVGLLGAGAGYLAIASTLNTTIQLQVGEDTRGKVLAMYIMFLTAAVPAGALVQGWAAERFGPGPTVAAAGVLFVAVTLWLRYGSRAMLHVDGRDQADPREIL